MSWVTVIWAMVASACFTLALVNGLVWSRRREARAHALFALSAAATGAFALCELWMMRSETPAQFGAALRWGHVPIWILMVSLVGFVRIYLRAGRRWLGWLVVVARTLTVIINFACTPNLNYREISALHQFRFLGESVSVAAGIPNPWMLVGNLSLLLFIIFVADATASVWRRGDRRQALVIGGSIVLLALGGTVQAMLLFWGVIQSPIIVSLFYLGLLLAMGYELSQDLLHAAQLSTELHESEQRMALAAEAVNLGIWIRDLERGEIWASDKWRVLLGFTKSERLTYDGFLQRLHAEDRESVRQALTKAIEGGGSYEKEYRVVLPDGQVRWIASRGSVECNRAGKAALVRGVSLDITASKLAEVALRESEARFRAMADTAPVLIWMSGTDKLCTFVNKSWLDFTGRTLEQELGNGWAEGVHREDLDRCLDVYTHAFNARQDFMMEYRLRRADGEYGWVLDTGVPRIDADGTFLGYIGSCVDITRRKQTELEIAQQRNELAHLSRVTTLSVLSGSLAHELNQPLTAILSNAQAALRFLRAENVDRDELRAILKDIAEDDQRAGEIIRRLRAMVKHGEVQLQPLDLNEVLLETFRLVRSDLLTRNVTLVTQLATGLPPVSGDRVQLQQVMLNLILNGCEAMAGKEANPRELTVQTSPTERGGLQVSVRDCGRGIPADQLDRIFEPFFGTKSSGLGLGLAISRRIVEAHGGKLQAANHETGGAIFFFELPNRNNGA